MLLVHLQRGISSGDPRSIDSAVGVLRHKARINGYEQPAQVGGVTGFQIKIHLGDSQQEEQDDLETGQPFTPFDPSRKIPRRLT